MIILLALGAAFPGTIRAHKKVGKKLCPIVKLNRLTTRKHSKQNQVALVRDNDDTQSSSEKYNDQEIGKGTAIEVSSPKRFSAQNNVPKVVISRCDGGTRIIHVRNSLTINDETETQETAREYSGNTNSEWTIKDSDEDAFVDSESSEEYLPSEHRKSSGSRYPHRKRKTVSRDIFSSDDSSSVSEMYRKKRSKTRATKENKGSNEFEDLPDLESPQTTRSKRPSDCIICDKKFCDRVSKCR